MAKGRRAVGARVATAITPIGLAHSRNSSNSEPPPKKRKKKRWGKGQESTRQLQKTYTYRQPRLQHRHRQQADNDRRERGSWLGRVGRPREVCLRGPRVRAAVSGGSASRVAPQDGAQRLRPREDEGKQGRDGTHVHPRRRFDHRSHRRWKPCQVSEGRSETITSVKAHLVANSSRLSLFTLADADVG